MNPKVFISHASEDKERFVLKFAEKLRANGVDAWLDKWEMLPGDSLIDKIFEEGLKNSLAVIIVLSNNSVNKPWVKEELNSSMINRIQKGTKVIPIKLDDCEIPEALKSLIWKQIPSLEDYQNSFERILAAIYNESMKPPLGESPKYTGEPVNIIAELSRVDSLIFKIICKYMIEKKLYTLRPEDIFVKNNEWGVSKEQVLESIEVLESEYLVKVSKYCGGQPGNFGCDVSLTVYGYQTYYQNYEPNYDKYVNDICIALINKTASRNTELVDQLKMDRFLVEHILELLENKELIKVAKYSGGHIQVWEISAKLKRLFQ